MIFDSEWLTEYLDGAPDLDTLAERLTDCGCLVELREAGDGAEKWDVEITTNRPDAMNHRGLAREAAVALDKRLRPLEFELEEDDEDIEAIASVEVEDSALCPRYVARVIRGLRIGPSPEWIQRRLLNCGVRPINAAVDATNYVLLELGQPLHAFDLDLLRGRRIVVRPAEIGEKLTTLDGEKRELDPSMLMIADGEGVVALAGIMGGADSEIHNGTTDVLLESAHFDALSVRRTARRLGMHTEASHRFERGTDPEMAGLACDRAAALIAELAGGRVCRGRVDVYQNPLPTRHMEYSVSALSSFAGLEIPAERSVKIFEGLGFAPQLDGDSVRVTVPSHRVDIDLVPDLYEEVIRHVGFAAIPSALPVLPATPGCRDHNWQLVDRARLAAASTGLAEIMTWSFIDPEEDGLVGTQPLFSGEAVEITNPLATTQSVMRRSLLPGMVAAAKLNLNQGEASLALFEQGRVFRQGPERPQERERLGIVLAQAGSDRTGAFGELKGVVEDVMDSTGMPEVVWRPGGAPWLDAEAGAELVTTDGAVVGFAGLLSDEYMARWDLRSGIAVAELELDHATEPPLPRFQPLPRHPPVVVDMTVEHGRDLAYADLEHAALELVSEWVEDLRNVARFVPPKNPTVVRTTLRLVYRHSDRSLTQDEVNAAQTDLRDGLAERLGITFA